MGCCSCEHVRQNKWLARGYCCISARNDCRSRHRHILRAGLCSSRSSAGGGVSSQWPCTIQLRRLLIPLWILQRARSRWRRPLTFGYGIRRPSAPYRLAAHDWTCDRAIIALEHDLPFSSAYIFLFFKQIYGNNH